MHGETHAGAAGGVPVVQVQSGMSRTLCHRGSFISFTGAPGLWVRTMWPPSGEGV